MHEAENFGGGKAIERDTGVPAKTIRRWRDELQTIQVSCRPHKRPISGGGSKLRAIIFGGILGRSIRSATPDFRGILES